jgi:hypothetical protein
MVEHEDAAVRPVHDLLDPRNGAVGQEREQRGAVERLADREPQPDRARARGTAATSVPGAAAQLRRRPRVDRPQRLVELAQAAEAGADRDLPERQVGRLDQRARRLGALRARQRHRPGPDLRHEDAVELALREVQPRREPAHAVAVHGAVGDQAYRPAGDVGAAIPRGRAGRGIRVAALAGAEALLLRGRGAPEEANVAAARQPRRAARPAVHARRGDGDEEEPVVARVAALHEAVAALEVVDHPVIVARPAGGFRTRR